MFFAVKKIYVLLAVLFIALALVLPSLTVLALDAKSKPVIVIDAGHGGADGGVKGVSTGVSEATVNLAIAKLLEGYFKSDGYNVVMTRDSDALKTISRKLQDMQNRVDLVNRSGAELLISVHVNYCPWSTRRGIQVFYTKSQDTPLAQELQDHLNSALNVPSIGRNFAPLQADYYLLANSNCPSALIECGFFSNKEDEALLLDENYRMRLAYEIFSAVKLMKSEE